MSKAQYSITFKIYADTLTGDVHTLINGLRSCSADRSTDRCLRWNRIDGRGFTLWLSDVCVGRSGGRRAFEIYLEATSQLPAAGLECWEETKESIAVFLEEHNLEYEMIVDS